MTRDGRGLSRMQRTANLPVETLAGTSPVAWGATSVLETQVIGGKMYLPVCSYIWSALWNQLSTSAGLASGGNIISLKLASSLVSFRTSTTNVPGAGAVFPSYRQPSPVNVARMTSASLESPLHPAAHPAVARATSDTARCLRSIIAALTLRRATRRWRGG